MSHRPFIDARSAPKKKKNQSKYYKGSVFVLEARLDKTFVISSASQSHFEVGIYGSKNLSSKNMITINGFKHVSKQHDLDELKRQLYDANIVIPGMEYARVL